MASMTITASAVAQLVNLGQTRGDRQFSASITVNVTANTYTSTRYVHCKIIDSVAGSVYAGYKKYTSKAKGNFGCGASVRFTLDESAARNTYITHTYIVYTKVTTSASMPGSTGWINKGTFYVSIPGLTEHRFYYYLADRTLQTSSYELSPYVYYTPDNIRRFKNWKDYSVYPTAYSFHEAGATVVLRGNSQVVQPINHYIYPETYPIVMKHKVNGAWLDGTPKIKVDGAWLDPVDMFVKVDGEWIQA